MPKRDSDRCPPVQPLFAAGDGQGGIAVPRSLVATDSPVETRLAASETGQAQSLQAEEEP